MAGDAPNRGPQLLAVDVLFLITAVASSLLRCFVRITMVKAFGIDDWLMAVATITFILYCSSSITGVHYGTGQHHDDLAPENIQHAKKFWWFCYIFYCTTMITSKLSIGWFLLRITTIRIHKWIIYIASMLTVVTGVVFFFVTLFQCSPVRYFWDQYEGQAGQCINIEIIIALVYLYSSINVVVDFSFALLPAFLIWGLQLERRVKILLIPLLAMGCVASAAVVVRLAYVGQFRDPDFLWATLDIAVWSTVEQGLAIAAGSLATLRPLLRLAATRFGWSKPSASRPLEHYGRSGSRGGMPGGSSGRKSSRVLDGFNLSKITRKDEESSGGSSPHTVSRYAPELTYQSDYVSSKIGSTSKAVPGARSESREELRGGTQSSKGSLDEAPTGVVITKGWLVTEEEKSG